MIRRKAMEFLNGQAVMYIGDNTQTMRGKESVRCDGQTVVCTLGNGIEAFRMGMAK